MALISDAYMKSLLKTTYLSGVSNAKYQNSPVLSAIGKESWGGGDEIRYAVQYSNGGNVGSIYSTIANDPTSGARNKEWAMNQGYLCGMFNVSQPEILTSAEDRGAYMEILSNKMAGCFDGMSKTLAMYLYGGKWGVIDQLQEDLVIQSSGNKIKLTSAGALKLDLGSRFVIATEGSKNKAKPSSNLASGVFTVTAIDDTTITFDSTVGSGNVYEGDYIELYTSRKGAEARGIEGLADIIPAYFNREGEDWDSYIKETFRGVDRSEAVNRFAGQFVKADKAPIEPNTPTTRLSDAMVSLLKKTKRAGGLNNMLIINDETFDEVAKELNLQKNLWQSADNGVNKQSATVGMSDLATAFGDAFISKTILDPFCTAGLAYSLEKDDLKFYDLGNVSRVINPVANDQMGKADIESVGNQGFGNDFGSHLNLDKLFTVEQSIAGEYGPEFRIGAHIYGNFAIKKTASMGVAVLK